MSSRARVTVVIFTYNTSRFIAEALDSVLAKRSSFEYEVVVFDNCSTDGTTEIVLEYARRFPKGVRAAIPEANRNDNMIFAEVSETSRAEYIALLDGDDSWPRSFSLKDMGSCMGCPSSSSLRSMASETPRV
jgi:glycosyltransferase involved in cell wall biosynthesis